MIRPRTIAARSGTARLEGRGDRLARPGGPDYCQRAVVKRGGWMRIAGGGDGVGFNYDQGPDLNQSGQISPLVGTLGGAGAGALLGRVLAGGHDNTTAILGGALLGGLAGNLGTNAFNERKEQQATTQYDEEQQLAYTQ